MDDRIDRIRTKLAALPTSHEATLDPPLPEERVARFEDAHGVRLPEEFRRFLTRVGSGGYGPDHGLLPLHRWQASAGDVCAGRLSAPFPVVPDLDVPEGPEPNEELVGAFPGTITVVHRGCSDYTLLVVTGPGRGRLVEVNAEGFFSPRFHSDPDFLAWYERWLDFVLTGHRSLNRFADQMAGGEEELVATLLGDALPARRRAAAYTFLTHPRPGPALPATLLRAYEREPHPAVREGILRAMAAQGERGRALLAAALADEVAKVRSLAAVLMTVSVAEGRWPSASGRRALAERLAVEEDPSVHETIRRMLDRAP
ncbi:SMI1/KNR4 family protein [Streptomyces roseicoloratus]|uniref:SMI1/KNR4 family protein n=1 Tax=Streptomyces roseicoloratus TaxID=2508722 RepID=UPI001009FDD3|nr:SMI1/KNR4 family protein [Streptomyces roseicoloratus]